MKKLTALSIILCASLACAAQIGKGKSVIAGFVSYYSSSHEVSSTTNTHDYTIFSLSPRYGYLVSNGTELGINIGYFSTTADNTDNGPFPSSYESTENSFFIGPYAKFYESLAEKFYFNFSGGFSYYTGSNKETNTSTFNSDTQEADISEYRFTAGPGLTYLFNNHWAMDLSLGVLTYDSTKKTDKESKVSTTDTYFTFRLNASEIGFGLEFYF